MQDEEYVADGEALVALCKELSYLWRSRKRLEPSRRGKRPLHTGTLVTIHGVVAHTHRVAEAALDLMLAGKHLEAAPLVRLCYESGLTAHWLAQAPDGAEAFVNKDLIGRRNAAVTLSKSASPLLRSEGERLAAGQLDLHATGSQAQARSMEQLCNDLSPGGAEAYVYYRILCWYSHPSSHVVDHYILMDEAVNQELWGAEHVRSLRMDPAPMRDPTMNQFFLAASLVWAGRAIDFLDQDRTHRNRLRAAAKSLGIHPELQLTFEARQRIEAAARARRRQGSKGPRG